MSRSRDVEIAIIGAGFAGIATAYYLCREYRKKSVLLVDNRQPMSFTSAQSGDNYRNWWPYPTMVEFANYSTDLMERIALESPEGGDRRTWVKLGWAYNREAVEPQQELTSDPHFNPQFP